uniref:Putative ovule protein n=1 Tax=Solanum chacoense TaxID=4108 RepID=A0A0V0I5T5_SOLCH
MIRYTYNLVNRHFCNDQVCLRVQAYKCQRIQANFEISSNLGSQQAARGYNLRLSSKMARINYFSSANYP